MRTLQKIFKIIIIPIFRTTELCSGEDPRKRPRKVLHGGFIHNLACKWLKILSSRHFYLQTGFKKNVKLEHSYKLTCFHDPLV